MKKYCVLPFSLTIGLGTSVVAAAAEPVADENIIVIGRVLPPPPASPAYGAVLLDQRRIATDASGRLENLLGQVAGFQQFRRSDSRAANPSAQGATLRALGGNASSRTLVLLDGVPMADPFFGYIPFSALMPNQLEAVRVTRGGGNGAFGAGAVAGTIELISPSRTHQPYMYLSGAYGSYDSVSLSGDIAPDIGKGFAVFSLRLDQGDGFYTTPDTQRVAASVPARYESTSASVRGVMPLNDSTELQWRAMAFDDARTLRFAGADSTSKGEDAHLRVIHNGAWQWDALAYYQHRNFSNVVISATRFRPSLNQYDTPSRGWGGKIEVRPPVSDDHVLRLGADMRGARGQMFEEAYNAATGAVTARRRAGGEQASYGFFAEDDWTLGDIILTGGVRADYWRIAQGFFETAPSADAAPTRTDFPTRDGWEASARTGFLWKAGSDWHVRGAAYTGFRLPTLNELYRPFSVFPVTTQANADLRQEKLRGFEAGLDYQLPQGKIALTYFYNKLKNAIANVTIDTNLRQRRNVDAVLAQGLEVEGEYRWSDFGLNISYAYMHSRVEAPGQSFDGLVPAQSPKHIASATLAYTLPQSLQMSVTGRYVGMQNEDDLGLDRLTDNFTVDMRLLQPLLGNWALDVRAENITDAKVMTRNAGGSIDYGTPRILWIGFRYQR